MMASGACVRSNLKAARRARVGRSGHRTNSVPLLLGGSRRSVPLPAFCRSLEAFQEHPWTTTFPAKYLTPVPTVALLRGAVPGTVGGDLADGCYPDSGCPGRFRSLAGRAMRRSHAWRATRCFTIFWRLSVADLLPLVAHGDWPVGDTSAYPERWVGMSSMITGEADALIERIRGTCARRH